MAENTPEKKAPPAPKAKPEPPAPPQFILSSSPHVRTKDNIETAMYQVILALIPATVGAFVFFGIDAARVLFFCIAGCLGFEALCLKLMAQPRLGRTLFDGSAFLTGLLLALNLPSSAPWWLCLIGAAVAMVIAKHVFGGLGANPFNPALVARVFLLIAWPARMTHWPVPNFFDGAAAADATTAATPLGMLWMDPKAALTQFDTLDVFLGNVGGCMGETSALLLLIGGVFLIARGVIRWEVPVAYIASFGILATIAWYFKPEFGNPLFQIFAGGLIIGAFFMATDYVTSPMAPQGMLIFGFGCGLITFLIRYFGAFPEGVSFSILIMNSLVPLIDRYIVPKRIGIQDAGQKTKAAA